MRIHPGINNESITFKYVNISCYVFKAFCIVPFLFVLSCVSNDSKVISANNSKFTFKLIDNLGSVSIDFPEQTDTFFSWIQKSDCGKPCEHGDYRFQSKSNRIFKESGFFWIGEPEDSVNQLTIYHQRVERLLPFNDSLIFYAQNSLLKRMLADPATANVLMDTVIKINDRNFYIFKVANLNKNNVFERSLVAFTTISGTILEFHYKLLTTTYDSTTKNFFDQSLKNLLTVKLKDGN